MIGVRRLENIRELGQRVIDEAIPGHFIETGAWPGGCCILMRGILAANAINDRRVYAAEFIRGAPAAEAARDVVPTRRGTTCRYFCGVVVNGPFPFRFPSM